MIVAVVHDFPDGHGGSGTFLTFIRDWPEYGEAAREGLNAFRALLEGRGIDLMTMDDADPRIDYGGRSQSLAEIDRCVARLRESADRCSGLLAIVAKLVAVKADVFVVGPFAVL